MYTVIFITPFPIEVIDIYSTEGWLFIISIDSNFHATTFAVAPAIHRQENIQVSQHQPGGRARTCAYIQSCKIKLQEALVQEAIAWMHYQEY